MGLNVGSLPVKQVYVGSTPVKAVYVGGKKIWPTVEVHHVNIAEENRAGVASPLVRVSVPAGQTWKVRIRGTVTEAGALKWSWLTFRIGSTESEPYRKGSDVDFSGTITSDNSTIDMVSPYTGGLKGFAGTVTIEK